MAPKGISIGGRPGLPSDIGLSMSNAVVWLERKLFTWNVGNCDQVGLQMLMSSLLDLLHQKTSALISLVYTF